MLRLLKQIFMKNLPITNHNRIALIGVTEKFGRFSLDLEKIGFEVFWVTARRSDARLIKKKLSVPSCKILDVTENFNEKDAAKELNIEKSRKVLKELETENSPRIYDIILMDRFLRQRTTNHALIYLEHIYKELSEFLTINEISIICSGRDTALQLISMLIGKKLDILWVVPTRLRIPLDNYGFCIGHETNQFIRFFQSTLEDRLWAEKVLEAYEKNYYRPALKKATRTFYDVLKMMPEHLNAFWTLIIFSYWDWGNLYARYSLLKIIRMYISRRINLLSYNIFRCYRTVGSNPYCLYALHTQPESSIDVAGSFFSNQIALITFISRSLPVSHELYVKVHPTDVDGKSFGFYNRISKIPGVRLINYNINSRQLLQKASIIFTLTGTIGYEAGLLGKSVVTFAKNFYNDLPTVIYCDAPPKLPQIVNDILTQSSTVNLRERIIDFLVDYRGKIFDGEFNRAYGEHPGPLLKDDLLTLQKAFLEIHKKL